MQKNMIKSRETLEVRIEKIEYMITRFQMLGHDTKLQKAKAKLSRLNTIKNSKELLTELAAGAAYAIRN